MRRAWVLCRPYTVLCVLAWDYAMSVVGMFMRVVLAFLRRRPRQRRGVADGRGGAVAIIQRFGRRSI
jgi:hypothetical protein